MPAIVKLAHLDTIALQYPDGTVQVLPALTQNTRVTVTKTSISFNQEVVVEVPAPWAKPFSAKMLDAYAHLSPGATRSVANPIMVTAIVLVMVYLALALFSSRDRVPLNSFPQVSTPSIGEPIRIPKPVDHSPESAVVAQPGKPGESTTPDAPANSQPEECSY